MRKHLLLTALLSTVGATGALAQVSQLGTTLTPWGAIKAGSADGLVPAYTGGIAAMSGLPNPGYTANGPVDPFANEKPIFTVTMSNMAQYDALLTPGEKALLQRFGAAGYYINVYPSHRTMSYPDWVNQNSIADATRVTESQPPGSGEEGAYGGVPFPLPKDGYEVMWDFVLAYHPAYCYQLFQNYLIDTSGNVTFLGDIRDDWAYTYYDPNQTKLNTDFYYYFTAKFHSPPPEDGTTFLFQYPYDFNKSDDVTWFYDPGTRRIRIAPEFKYDTPVASYGGAIDFDEIDLFYGEMNKFSFKLIGLQEKIVPYNDFALANTTESTLLRPQFINPAVVRWEVHRVWVVNAVLKPGERHVYSQWNFYIDEDSYGIMASESYDHAGDIYRVGFRYPYSDYYDGAAVNFSHSFGFYDLSKGNYEFSIAENKPNEQYNCTTTLPNMANYTPQAVATQGVE